MLKLLRKLFINTKTVEVYTPPKTILDLAFEIKEAGGIQVAWADEESELFKAYEELVNKIEDLYDLNDDGAEAAKMTRIVISILPGFTY